MNSDLYFDGKKYISVRRAAEESGYSTDYIGQLCRTKKLECKMIGRGWFVSESSLSDHQNSFSGDRNKIPSSPNIISEIVSNIKKVEEVEVGKKDEISSSRDIRDSLNPFSQFIYSSDEKPLIPELNKLKNEQAEKIASVCHSRASPIRSLWRRGECKNSVSVDTDTDPRFPSLVRNFGWARRESDKISLIQIPDNFENITFKNRHFKRALQTGTFLFVLSTIVLAIFFAKDASQVKSIYKESVLFAKELSQNGAVLVGGVKNYFAPIVAKKEDYLFANLLSNNLAGDVEKISNRNTPIDALNNISLKIYDGVNEIISGTKKYFAGFFDGKNKLAEKTITPIKKSSSSRSSSSTPPAKVALATPHLNSSPSPSPTYNLQPTTYNLDYNLKPDITRREVLDLIKQYDDNSKALIYATNAANGENSLTISQSISGLEKIISNLQYVNSRQLDKPASIVSRSDADIKNISGASVADSTITSSSFSGTTGTFTGLLTGTAGTFSGNITVGSQLTVSGTATSTVAGDVSFDSGTFYIDSINNRVGIGTTSPYAKLSVVGPVVAEYFHATSSTATSTFSGQTVVGFAPTLAHSFGSWSVGASGANPLGASLIINPSSAASDSNLLSLSVNGSAKFLVDAEGDVFANAVTVVGGTTLSTTTASTFTVENNTNLGDATTTDITYFNSRIADSLIPTADNLLDLGDSANWLRWRTGYFGTSVGIGGTATSTGTQLTTSGAYLIDSGNTLSINTTNNKAVSFGTGNVVLPYASSTALTVSNGAWFTGGNVGVGTTSPYAKLSVVGETVASYFTATTTSTSTLPQLDVTGLQVASFSELGTVSSGAWQGSAVGSTYGGTGINSSALTGLAQIVAGTWSASSTLSAAFGGTGWNSLQANTVLLGNGAGRISTTTAGTDGYVLALSNGVPTWLATSTLSTITGTLAVAKGGTGQTSFGQGWLNSNGTDLSASTSPTVNYITATSTTATSTFPYLSVTTNSNLGTVVGGTWQGTAVGSIYGGTGIDSSALTGIAQIVSGTWSASSTLSTAYGGTGWNNIQSNSILLGNGAGRIATTTAGTDGYVLALSSGVPTWLATSTLSTITGTLAVGKGGTGQTSFGQGWLNSNGTDLSASTSPTVNYITATSTTATSTFPYLSVTTNSNLGTVVGGTWQGTAIGDAYLTKSGDWTGTLDTYNGSDLLARANHTGTQGVSTLSNYDWTFLNNYGAVNLTGSSTKPIWAQGGLNASSTSNFVYASTTALTASGNSYLGTISSGTWNGAAISNQYGGTGINSSALTGIAQIVSGTWSASSTLSVAFGGTGWNSIAAGYIPFGNGAAALATSTSFYWDNDNSRLGIGTTTPNSKLTVFNNANDSAIEFSSASGDTYKWTMGMDYSDAGKFKIASSTALGSVDRFTIDGRGYIGIGTSTPARRLEVADSGTSNAQLRLTRETDVYTDFSVAQTTGDLSLNLYGTNANDISLYMPDGSTGANLWVCEGAACPSLTLSDGGNIVVERDIKYPTSGRMKRSIVLTAAGGIVPTSGGATKTQVDTATSSYYVLDFSNTATSSAFWQWTIPDSYDGGNITAIHYWFSGTAGSGSEGVSWCSQYNGINTAENINADLSSASCDTTANNVPTTANRLATTTQTLSSSLFTPGEVVTFKVSRGVDNSNDNFAQTARLYMVKLEYGVSAESD